MNKRGQVSIEYIMIIGAVFVVIVPLFYYTMTQTSENLRLSQMTDAIDTLSVKANSVCSLAPGTTLYADINIPSGIIYTNITKNIINAKTRRFGDVYKNTICEVNGTLPSRQGTYKLPITKLPTGIVYIGNISLETVLLSCTNGVRDGDESDVDCGGSCSKCSDGKQCNSASDCMSGYCSAGNLCFTPPQTTCEELFGNAAQNSGATNPTNALLIDGNYAVLPSNNNWVRAVGFTAGTGQIISVELGMRYRRAGTYTNDRVVLRYYIGGAQSSVYQEYGDASAFTTVYLDVSSARAWGWADIGNLGVDARYNAVGTEDALDWHIDSLWVRVCHTS